MRGVAAGRTRRRAASAACGMLAVAALAAGCTPVPWGPAPTTTAPPMTTAPVSNDLADGGATRELRAGAVSVTVDYWSTLSMDRWTAEALKPFSVALRAVVTPPDGQRIYLSRVTLQTTVADLAGAPLPAPEPIVDEATVDPGYLVLDPYSYSQTFTLPALDPAAAAVELSLRYELLVQAEPGSEDYAKATAVDTLTVAIAPPSG